MLTQLSFISERLPMSALASPAKNTAQSLTQAEADLRTEAVAIEKLRKSIGEAGAAAPKEQMADFAKRQKAYLDRKIDLEKRKRTFLEAPAPKSMAQRSPEPETNTVPVRPKPPGKAPAEIAASKATAPKPKAEFVVEKKPVAEPQAELPLKDLPVEKPKVKTERTTMEESYSPREKAGSSKTGTKNGGVAPIVWILLAAAIAVIAWHFLG